ncbi:hypothetical protein [Acaryochloris thomasi]|uniref:hypothetical protein n=1 Tax=Acaryochloris thomasi TaxID=2929456 RepID=UPI0011B4C33B|nr:hypothetical protein [Acaryochloris thomasi]
MQTPTLPPRLQTNPQHAIAVAIATLINDLLFAGRIDWHTAVYYCPPGVFHLLECSASHATVAIKSMEA